MSLDRASFLVGVLSALIACGPGRAILSPSSASADNTGADTGVDTETDDRIAELEQRVDQLESALASALNAMDNAELNARAAQDRVTELEDSLDAAIEANNDTLEATLGDHELRLTAVEDWRDQFMDTWESEDLIGRVEDLEGR